MRSHLFIFVIVLGACAAKEQPALPKQPVRPEPVATIEAPAAAFTKIADRSTVCMVNDRDMGAPQIPVLVEGRTYYGCCKMCEKRLREDASVRSATDPVSHQKVDKAVAMLARDSSGNVFYFADETSLKKVVHP